MAHQRLLELCDQIKELHKKKSEDYGGQSSLGNFDEARQVGLTPLQGCMVRLTDKYSRACKFMRSESYAVQTESFEDTLLDLAVYSLIAIVLTEEQTKQFQGIEEVQCRSQK